MQKQESELGKKTQGTLSLGAALGFWGRKQGQVCSQQGTIELQEQLCGSDLQSALVAENPNQEFL